MELYFFYALLMAIACAMLASRYDRSAIGWFIASLFIGIFGLIFLVILGDREKQAQKVIVKHIHTKSYEDIETADVVEYRDDKGRLVDEHGNPI